MRQDLYSLREIENFSKMNPERRIEYFKRVAAQALPFWGFDSSTEIKLLNYTENATFKVIPKDADPFIMRIHRALYTTKNSILSEIDWLKSLSDDGIYVPTPIPMKNGGYVAEIKTDLGDSRLVDCSKFENGVPPMEIPDAKSFERLGEIIARLHLNAEKYKKPDFYERIVWNEDETFTLRNNYHFIDYCGAKVFTEEDKAVLHQAEAKIRNKLAAYGKTAKNYGLIHSDVRFSNILVDNGQFKVLDFDDAGDGWFMFDVGGILATNEDIPEADAIMEAVLKGYTRVRALSSEDMEMIPTFQLFRRLGVVAFSQFIVVESVLGDGETCSTENSFWNDYYKRTVEAAKKYLKAA